MGTKKSNLRFLAAALFLLSLLWMVIENISYGGGFDLWAILEYGAFAAAILGFLTGVYPIAVVFCGIEAFLYIRNIPGWALAIIENMGHDFLWGLADVLGLLRCVLSAVALVLLAVAIFNNRRGVICGLAAAVLSIAGLLLSVYGRPLIAPEFYYAPGLDYMWQALVWNGIYSAALATAGIAMARTVKKQPGVPPQMPVYPDSVPAADLYGDQGMYSADPEEESYAPVPAVQSYNAAPGREENSKMNFKEL